MIDREIKIKGMSCEHCVMAVRKELSRISGVEVKDVRIGSAVVSYDERAITSQRLNEAVEEAGYTVLE